jgi:C-5 cytosine-specific DNA methylase
LQGDSEDETGQALPARGKVDMISGGTPCQGFSGLNKHMDSDESIRNVSINIKPKCETNFNFALSNQIFDSAVILA